MVKGFHKRERIDSLGRSSILPYLPITLSNGRNSVEVMALLDTGASVNVLPYEIGLQRRGNMGTANSSY
ncbi:hypothetical protein QUB63_11075 [Microcoleus sp. ARI1-B5]|uniref:hypothetical protein n=1 Tax=unclassified Microcoleus TaxID=2642155 RepID=UPI002FD208D5